MKPYRAKFGDIEIGTIFVEINNHHILMKIELCNKDYYSNSICATNSIYLYDGEFGYYFSDESEVIVLFKKGQFSIERENNK